MFEIEAPGSTEELRAELRKLHGRITSSLDEFTTEEFSTKQGEHWSPAEHIRHLSTAVRAVVRGMAAPRLLLALRFGLSFEGSRSFEQVRDSYRAALAAGGKASGLYDPASRKIDLKPEDLRRFVMQRWAQTDDELDSAIASWRHRALDRYRAKHPLLGLMTIRELLYFTLYHNAHHARRISERRS